VRDNLVKGSAGQAIQNMNLMLGFPEQAGLGPIALFFVTGGRRGRRYP
jgi:N-acetyl-gamma-glutamyl-phosphate reductase